MYRWLQELNLAPTHGTRAVLRISQISFVQTTWSLKIAMIGLDECGIRSNCAVGLPKSTTSSILSLDRLIRALLSNGIRDLIDSLHNCSPQYRCAVGAVTRINSLSVEATSTFSGHVKTPFRLVWKPFEVSSPVQGAQVMLPPGFRLSRQFPVRRQARHVA